MDTDIGVDVDIGIDMAVSVNWRVLQLQRIVLACVASGQSTSASVTSSGPDMQTLHIKLLNF